MNLLYNKCVSYQTLILLVKHVNRKRYMSQQRIILDIYLPSFMRQFPRALKNTLQHILETVKNGYSINDNDLLSKHRINYCQGIILPLIMISILIWVIFEVIDHKKPQKVEKGHYLGDQVNWISKQLQNLKKGVNKLENMVVRPVESKNVKGLSNNLEKVKQMIEIHERSVEQSNNIAQFMLESQAKIVMELKGVKKSRIQSESPTSSQIKKQKKISSHVGNKEEEVQKLNNKIEYQEKQHNKIKCLQKQSKTEHVSPISTIYSNKIEQNSTISTNKKEQVSPKSQQIQENIYIDDSLKNIYTIPDHTEKYPKQQTLEEEKIKSDTIIQLKENGTHFTKNYTITDNIEINEKDRNKNEKTNEQQNLHEMKIEDQSVPINPPPRVIAPPKKGSAKRPPPPPRK